MTLTPYPCGCLYVANHLAPAPPTRCNHHQTEPEPSYEKRHGWIGLDRRDLRYVWMPLLMPWMSETAQIRFEKLVGAEIGTVDGGMLRPAGGRPKIWIL